MRYLIILLPFLIVACEQNLSAASKNRSVHSPKPNKKVAKKLERPYRWMVCRTYEKEYPSNFTSHKLKKWEKKFKQSHKTAELAGIVKDVSRGRLTLISDVYGYNSAILSFDKKYEDQILDLNKGQVVYVKVSIRSLGCYIHQDEIKGQGQMMMDEIANTWGDIWGALQGKVIDFKLVPNDVPNDR